MREPFSERRELDAWHVSWRACQSTGTLGHQEYVVEMFGVLSVIIWITQHYRYVISSLISCLARNPGWKSDREDMLSVGCDDAPGG